ncbi:hypothetical protein BpHYR1_042200 [Brachionus plicatilis]|uniref:Uncharacterized protein n=1 Tax=Brachionus plicatilis TaxID=10195 RepID=A0A3M7SH22_BRAPC|nr:hypothetical protein BpHYR1_042200 [Brachionus plicatilis]
MMKLKFDLSLFALLNSCLIVTVLSKRIDYTFNSFEYPSLTNEWKRSNGPILDSENVELAKSLGFYNIHNCQIPEVIAKNSMFYDHETSQLNLIKLLYTLRKLFKQMILRYGSDEIEKALKGFPSAIRYDTIDNVFFDINNYVSCSQNN